MCAHVSFDVAAVSAALTAGLSGLAEGRPAVSVLEGLRDLPDHPALNPLRTLSPAAADPEFLSFLLQEARASLESLSRTAAAAPLKLLDPETPARAAQTLEAIVAATPEARPGKAILVVDDEPSILELMEHILVRAGYAVFKAMTGEEALGVFAAHASEIGVLLTDTRMPRMSGLELVGHVRRLNPSLPIVLSSGGEFAPSERAAFTEIGVGGFLIKPFQFHDVEDVVRRVLEAQPVVASDPGVVADPDQFARDLPGRLESLELFASLLQEMIRMFRRASGTITPEDTEHPVVRIHDLFFRDLSRYAPLWQPDYAASAEDLMAVVRSDNETLATRYIEGINAFMPGIRERVDRGLSREAIARYILSGIDVYHHIVMAEIIYRMARGRFQGAPDLHNAKNRAQALLANADLPNADWAGLVLRETGRSLPSLAAHWISGMRAMAEGRGISLSFHSSGFENPSGSGEGLSDADQGYLEMALTELITNALHHGSTQVRVQLVREGQAVTLTVSDDGDGMSLEKLADIRTRHRTASAGDSVTGWGGGLEDLYDRLPQGWVLNLSSKAKPAPDHGTVWNIKII